MAKITIGFFRSDSPVMDRISEKLIEFAAQPKPLNISRTATLDQDTPVLLRNIQRVSDGAFLLDFTRIRDIPSLSLSDLSGNEDRITFAGEKRPAEYTTAVLDPSSRVLAIQENAYGISPAMVAKYWQVIIPDLPRFRFDPILEQRAADLLMTSGGFSRFSLRLAHMGMETQLASLGLPNDEVLRLINSYASPNIAITFSIDPRSDRTSLSVDRIRELARALVGLGKRHVKKLSLVTEDEEGHRFPVNLLRDRILVQHQLSRAEREDLTDEIRYTIVRDGWESRQNELRSRYEGVD